MAGDVLLGRGRGSRGYLKGTASVGRQDEKSRGRCSQFGVDVALAGFLTGEPRAEAVGEVQCKRREKGRQRCGAGREKE
jgi:hypothetical protein